MLEITNTKPKRYNLQCNIGKCKYVVNHYDGIKKHPDGSDFFDIHIFRNKLKMSKFIKQLENEGYKETA